MGVAGLWEILRPAGQVRSLTDLAVEDGFNANPSHHRGFRIGIDASIWFFHATYGREGENPELRTLFFRCCRLLQSPLLPLFVFDGPNRPAIKRGKRVGQNAHWLTQGMKNIIDAFGFEWWVAPGEAEAELAYLNRIGVIDAVLSDDVDNFLFGATTVIRNPSNTLSGNRAHPVKNAHGKDDGNHVVTYKADAILSHPSVSLSRQAIILIGLLSGGDYIPAGLPGCGQKFATGLARAGFGDSLFMAVRELKGARLDAFLDQWREDVKCELRTNKSGLLPSKKPSLATSLPDDFPSLPVFTSYADPLTTENTPQKGKRKLPPGGWKNDPDPMKIASICELYFEWGVKDVIVQRFRTVLWPGMVCRAVRRSVMDEDSRQHPASNRVHRYDDEEEDTASPSSPTKRISSTLSALTLSSPLKKPTSVSASDSSSSELFVLSSLVRLTLPVSPSSSRCASPSASTSSPNPLLLEILSQRTHVSTDATLEYRVLVDPTTLVERAESGVKGLRPPLIGGLFGTDPSNEGEDTPNESGSDDGIERLETAADAAAKSGKKKRKARREIPTTPLRIWLPACMVRAAVPEMVEAYEEKLKVREQKKAKRGTKGTQAKSKRQGVVGDEDGGVPLATEVSKSKPKVGRTGGARRKPKQASEAQDDAYELIDLSAGESLRSSDRERDDEKRKPKARMGSKHTLKPASKNGASIKKAATTCVTKNVSKQSISSRHLVGASQKGSSDADNSPSLPKSTRPLDLLRAKPKSSTVLPKAKAAAVPRYKEEESSSSPILVESKLGASVPPQKAKKQPLNVDVSDTDSGIEASDVFDGTAAIAIYDPVRSDAKVVDRAINGPSDFKVISRYMLPTLEATPSERTLSAPRIRETRAGWDNAVRQSPGSESRDEEGSEGDELPTFHRGSIKSRTKETAVIPHPTPRPFPMQLTFESPVSPYSSRHRGRHNDESDGGDGIEITDVFTTPRAPSPPHSPTPSPSPANSIPVYIAAGFATRSSEFPRSPTSSAERQKKTKPRGRMSSDRNPSGSERDGTLKSPRKSAAHSSPRHCMREPSPTPSGLVSSCAALSWVDAEGRGDGSTCDSDDTGRPSDGTIDITSGSEDEERRDADDSDNRGGIAEEEEWTDGDQDVDGWANKGMILSVPPSPARDRASVEQPRASKFKPAPVGSTVAATRTEPRSSAKFDQTSTRPSRAPLLVARAKRNVIVENNVIDLTSD